MSVSCSVCLCVTGVEGVGVSWLDWLTGDGKAAVVWIKGSVLVSDKHWISAVISPLLGPSLKPRSGTLLTLRSRTCLDQRVERAGPRSDLWPLVP